VRRLIAKKGIDVSALDYSSSKQTLLHLAAWFGFADVVKVLLEAGADLAARDVCGRTPLHTAARGSYEEMVARLLLDAGAEVGASVQPAAGHGPQNGWTPLHCAAFNLHHSLVTLLLDRGADVHAKTSCHEQTALYFAVDRKDEKLVRLLVDRGADLDATDRSHILPLHEAIWNGSAKMIKLLADLGANLEASDN
ncbi:ankyrin repeat-containing domain protein, partial [Baffinella frigidus]